MLDYYLSIFVSAVGLVILWLVTDKIVKRWPQLDLPIKALKQLTLFMSPIYIMPHLLQSWNLTLFLILIPFFGVSAYWSVKWYRYSCRNDVEKKILRRTVVQMSASMTIVGTMLLGYLLTMSQFVKV